MELFADSFKPLFLLPGIFVYPSKSDCLTSVCINSIFFGVIWMKKKSVLLCCLIFIFSVCLFVLPWVSHAAQTSLQLSV